MLNEVETLSTLRFGQRAKLIKNVAKVNQDESVEQLKLVAAKLRAQLSAAKSRIAQLENTLKSAGIAAPALAAGFDEEGGAGAGGIGPVDSEEYAKLNDECGALKDENDDLMRQLKEQEAAAKEATGLLDAVQNEFDTAKYDLSEQASEIARYKAELNSRDADLEQIQMEKKNLKEELQDINERLART